MGPSGDAQILCHSNHSQDYLNPPKKLPNQSTPKWRKRMQQSPLTRSAYSPHPNAPHALPLSRKLPTFSAMQSKQLERRSSHKLGTTKNVTQRRRKPRRVL